MTLVKTALTTIKDVLSTMFSAIKTLVSNLFSSIGTTVQTKIKSIINSYIISPINRLIDWVNSKLAFDYGGLRIAGVQVIEPYSVKLAHIGSIPSLDVGTNYVPNDQLAMVHQGEAIIPKRFNSEEFFEQGSEETNDLLRELIEVIQKKDFDVNLDGRSLTRTVSKYQHSMARELGGAL